MLLRFRSHIFKAEWQDVRKLPSPDVKYWESYFKKSVFWKSWNYILGKSKKDTDLRWITCILHTLKYDVNIDLHNDLPVKNNFQIWKTCLAKENIFSVFQPFFFFFADWDLKPNQRLSPKSNFELRLMEEINCLDKPLG